MYVELHNIHKHFGAVQANNGITLTLKPGQIHGLLGENGAGKTTLMKILSGYQSKDSGDILLDGQRVDFHSPAEAIQAGIGMLHQDPLDFPPMTALENFLLGFDTRLIPNRRAARARMRTLAERLNFAIIPDAPVGRLTVGERQQLEILRLLALGVQIIILDEPTTGISAPQKVQLFQTLHQLTQEENKTVVFVSHKLEEVETLCNEVTVLRHGQVTGNQEMPVQIETLVRLMFGQSVALPDKPPLPIGKTVLTAEDVMIENQRLQVGPCHLAVRTGEVIGIAGMEGSGQSHFLRALAGLLSPRHGHITLAGQQLTGHPYREFLARGVSLLPADRIDEGLVKGLSIAEHFPLRRSTPFFIDWAENQTYTQAQIDFFNIKGRPETPVDALSGGNQQRVLLALQQPNLKVLLLEHPTRGLDMESTRWVWEQLLKRREDGTAILFISADLDEIMTYSDRVVVFFNGQMRPPLPTSSVTGEQLGYMIGGKESKELRVRCHA
ncbi:MAG: ATP-binding cassette domain-containing protein [Anaerolineae bacterium]|nr:ATP-binding cassette domain-containing protein [Anaerolineae bacterium]